MLVTNPTWETMVSSVVSRAIGATAELSSIAKMYKYKGFHEWYHFILMAMLVHGIPRHMNRFIKECVCLFHNR